MNTETEKDDTEHKHLCVRCNELFVCINESLLCDKPFLCPDCRREVQECAQMEFEREASNELKTKRLESLIELQVALAKFGEAWQTAFPRSEREEHQSYLEGLAEINNLVGLVPPSLAFCLAACLANQIDKTMATLADHVTSED